MSTGDPPTDPLPGETEQDRLDRLERLDLPTPGPHAGSSMGIPYPQPTDPLMQGADAIRAVVDNLTARGFGTYNSDALVTGGDLNTLTQSGEYIRRSCANSPDNQEWVYVTVTAYTNDYVIQEARTLFPWAARCMWRRWRDAGSGWTPWIRTSHGRVTVGMVDGNGAPAQPTSSREWACSKIDAGTFSLSFNPAFDAPPLVIVQPHSLTDHSVDLPTASAVTVRLAGDNIPWSFLARDMIGA